MISAGVTVMGSSGSVEGTTGSITAPTKWGIRNLNTRTGSSSRRGRAWLRRAVLLERLERHERPVRGDSRGDQRDVEPEVGARVDARATRNVLTGRGGPVPDDEQDAQHAATER